MRYYISRILRIFPKLKNSYYKKWNVLKFYLAGAKVGKKMNVCDSVYVNIRKGGSLCIGDNFTFNSGDCLNALSRNIKGCIIVNSNAHVVIGNNVGMSSTCLRAHQSIKIGNNVKIGGDVIILDSDSHSLNYLERRSRLDGCNKIDKEVIVEDDVLIGGRCIILKGVNIGARSVIGAGSIVTKDIPSDCIAAGNPCRVIKYNKT